MNKFAYMLFVILCALSCTQPNKQSNVLIDKPVASAEKTVTKAEDFDHFFERFSTDSSFQKSHILFPLKITYKGYDDEDTDTVDHIGKNDWIYTNFTSPIIDGQKVEVEVDKKAYAVILKGYDSGINIEYYFKPDKSSWVLFKVDDYSN